eukprot:10834164-Lingulodinium_polyedra.AAC.1
MTLLVRAICILPIIVILVAVPAGRHCQRRPRHHTSFVKHPRHNCAIKHPSPIIHRLACRRLPCHAPR